MNPRVVIIGAGHGGIQAAASLRDEGFDGEIILISDENMLPYQKPPLSKGYLQGKQTEESILFRSPAYYENNRIDLRLGVTIDHLEPTKNRVHTTTGEVIDYTHLILATGARNRQLSLSGAEPGDILYLRTLADAKEIDRKLANAQRIAVIGGGFIGLEFAALAVEKEKHVTVIEAQSRLMERVLPAVISDVFQRVHEQHGVQLHLNTFTKSLEKQNDTYCLTTQDGQTLAVDLLVAGIGVIPDMQLAAAARLACDGGVLVDEYQQTSVPNVYAIGDCANHFNPFGQKRMRLESVQNAVDQAKTAVSHLLNQPKPYRAVPWFWTNQYHLKLQMAGISAGFDEYLIRGDQTTDKFSVYYYKAGTLIGVDSLNRPADHLNARKLLEAGVSPNQEQINDLSFNLNAVLV